MDLGLLRGFGIFDFLQNIGGLPMFIDDYLDRFENSARLMELEFPEKNRSILIKNILKLIKKNNFKHSGLRLVLTGGYSEDIFTPTLPNFIIIEQEIKQNADYQGFVNGEKLILHEYTREIPKIKTTNYIVPILLQKKWKSEGAVDVLYHENGFVTESSRSNFFIINEKEEILTPDENVLHGITRKKLIEIIEEKKLKLTIRNITLEETLNAKEAFITSSTKGVLPIVQLDHYPIGNKKVGQLTKTLMQDFIEMQNNYIKSQTKTKK
jgi:branched-subunit amino acid aminotransferase/4-amino-4-deoxychorismate lyase